jgi:hypothetical protein
MEMAMFKAIKAGSLETVKYLVKLGERPTVRWTRTACNEEQLEILKYFLDKLDTTDMLGNSNVQLEIDLGYTYSVKLKDKKSIKYFLVKGVSRYQLDDTAALYASRNDTERLELLRSLYAAPINAVLVGACDGGHVDLAVRMLSVGATDINIALAKAAGAGSVKLVKLLGSMGARRYTAALYHASYGGHPHVVNTLIEGAIRTFHGNELKWFGQNLSGYLDNISQGRDDEHRILGPWRTMAEVYHLHMWFLPTQRKSDFYQQAVRNLGRIQWVLQKKGVPSDVMYASILPYLF